MNKMKLTTLTLLGTTSLALSGCMMMKNNVTPDYTFSKQGRSGILAFSVRCNVAPGAVRMDFLRDMDGQGRTLAKSQAYHTLFKCNDTSESLTKPELKLISLPAGVYSFVGWVRSGYYSTIESVDFKPIIFYVTPRKVTYIGRFIFSTGFGSQYRVEIRGTKKDVNAIYKRLPRIKKKDVVVKPARFES